LGNIGLVFTNDDLTFVRDELLKQRIVAPARVGAIAPVDVFLEPQNTGMGPERTSFFQALHIATKISKGTIEILNRIHLIKLGDKVNASQTTLLNMLKVSPFTYGLSLLQVYDDGSVFEPKILDITDEILMETVAQAVRSVAAVSMAANFPTVASVPHAFVNGYKNVLAIALATNYSFPAADKVKEALKNPVAAAAPAAKPAAQAAAPKKEEPKKEEVKEESDEDMGFGLFD